MREAWHDNPFYKYVCVYNMRISSLVCIFQITLVDPINVICLSSFFLAMLLWTECFCHPPSPNWTVIYNVIIFGSKALVSNQTMKIETSWMWSVDRGSVCLLHVVTQLQARKTALTKHGISGTLILDILASRTMGSKCCRTQLKVRKYFLGEGRCCSMQNISEILDSIYK